MGKINFPFQIFIQTISSTNNFSLSQQMSADIFFAKENDKIYMPSSTTILSCPFSASYTIFLEEQVRMHDKHNIHRVPFPYLCSTLVDYLSDNSSFGRKTRANCGIIVRPQVVYDLVIFAYDIGMYLQSAESAHVKTFDSTPVQWSAKVTL